MKMQSNPYPPSIFLFVILAITVCQEVVHKKCLRQAEMTPCHGKDAANKDSTKEAASPVINSTSSPPLTTTSSPTNAPKGEKEDPSKNAAQVTKGAPATPGKPSPKQSAAKPAAVCCHLFSFLSFFSSPLLFSEQKSLNSLIHIFSGSSKRSPHAVS